MHFCTSPVVHSVPESSRVVHPSGITATVRRFISSLKHGDVCRCGLHWSSDAHGFKSNALLSFLSVVSVARPSKSTIHVLVQSTQELHPTFACIFPVGQLMHLSYRPPLYFPWVHLVHCNQYLFSYPSPQQPSFAPNPQGH